MSLGVMERLERARVALDGLSVGDAFGERFFVPAEIALHCIEQRAVPKSPWPYTDDTEMALAIYEVLEEKQEVDCDLLAQVYARRYAADIRKGYGGTAHDILRSIYFGEPWRSAAGRVFDGSGSMGNGGAMRVAPAAAYFAEDYDKVVEQARRTAEVTHANPEGQAGAIAVAVAVAWAWQNASAPEPDDMFETVLRYTPYGETQGGIALAADLPRSYLVGTAISALGNGRRVLAQDTVPFSLWCAARHLDCYEDAMWNTVFGLGDRDTTCAIVGGIVVWTSGRDSIPEAWLQAREPLRYRSESSPATELVRE